VLKDHELNIIKDFSDKTKETKQHLNQKLENLRATIKSKDEIIESQEHERKEKDDQIRLL
jgi:ribosome-binding protein aMBF1 (putative translation factor)